MGYVKAARPEPKGGKYDVLLPVALPGEGVGDWLDLFLEQNPHYTELSNRYLTAWAEKSGVKKGVQIASMQDGSAGKALQAVTPLQKRNFIIVETKGNLIKDDRTNQLKNWPAHSFKRMAVVAMGEPTTAVKERAKAALLAEKQKQLNQAFKLKKAEHERNKEILRRQREVDKQIRKAEKEKKKAEAEKKKKLEELKAKHEAEK